MKIIVFLGFLTFSSIRMFGINFSNLSVTESLKRAREQNKKVYVFFSSDNCMACTMMKNGVFRDELVSEMVDQNLIAVIVTMEKSIAKEWKSKYYVKSLPTCLILDDDGDEVSRYEGGMGTALFKEFIISAIDVSASGTQLKTLEVSPSPEEVVKPEPPVVTNSAPINTTPKTENQPIPIAEKIVHQEKSDAEVLKNSTSHIKGEYYIQFGAFATINKAKEHKNNIAKKSMEETTVINDGNIKSLFKLVSSQSYPKSEMDKKIKQLKSKGIDCFPKLF
ncbi:MAG: thioredoxin fold domain-containing protein [Saprospiraceae bacterium]|nr:thioredoxin fold domain-containing protein [Saprospiraceae bacterium]